MFGKKPLLRKLEWLTAVLCLLMVLEDGAHSKSKGVVLKSPGKTEKHSRTIATDTPPAGEGQAELMLRTVRTETPSFLEPKQQGQKSKKPIRVEKAKSLNYGHPGFTD